MSIACAILSTPYFFIFNYFGYHLAGNAIVLYVIAFLCPLILIRYKFYDIAKMVLLVVATFLLFFYSLILGKSSGAYLVFFAIVPLPIILYDFSSSRKFLFLILLPILAAYGLEFLDYSLFFKQASLSSEVEKIIHAFAMSTAFLFILVSVHSFYTSRKIYENQLLENIEELKQKQKIDKELLMAKDIQLKMLPLEATQLPGFIVNQYYQAARVVGGDFLDYVRLNDHQMVVVVADIVGKGIPASLMTQALKTVMDSTFKSLPGGAVAPAALMNELNLLFDGHSTIQRHVPMILGVLDNRDNTFTYSNAGHEPGLLMRASGEIVELSVGGSPLGMIFAMTDDDVEAYETAVITLNKGDKLLLITDGFTDIVNAKNDRFDNLQFQSLINKHRQQKGEHFISVTIQDCNTFQKGTAQADDMTMVLIERS